MGSGWWEVGDEWEWCVLQGIREYNPRIGTVSLGQLTRVSGMPGGGVWRRVNLAGEGSPA